MVIAQLIVDIFTCVGIIIALFEFHLLKKSTLADCERTQKQATMDLYIEIKEELYITNQEIYKRFKRNIVNYEDIENNEEMLAMIKRYLNIMELMAAGINTGIYNIDVFDRLYGDVTVRLADQLQDYIHNRRKRVKAPELYLDFELLVVKLKKMHEKRGQLLNPDASIKHKIL
ncbi:MAG: DUF4760 domain-containing protein [Bacteroides sp.]|nr:DUF4760 domain-containing protein [Bacteroides sp.]MCM1549650.1 DUF4760 domain-containing protein [Clostridium sp.]